MPWRTDAGLTIDKEWQKAGMRNANGIPFSPLSSFTVESGAIGAGKEGGREREGGGGGSSVCTVVRTVYREGEFILCKDSRLILAHLEYLMRRVRG